MIVLIADDNRLLLSTLAMVIRANGHEVLEADSGARALALADRTRPDAAIIDLHMPLVSGAEVASHLQSLEIPFFFISAYDEFDVRNAADAWGARGYLLKPTTEDELNDAIARCGEGRRR
jgi:two-component system, LytTR family, response regulator AlgR